MQQAMQKRFVVSLASAVIMVITALAFLFGSPARADLIKQSGTYNRTVLMTDSADHIAAKTGLTLTVQVSKNGGAYSTITPVVTEIGAGRYKISLTGSHTDTLGVLDLKVTATGADPSDTHDQIVGFDPNDSSLLGLSGVATASAQATNASAIAALPSASAIANAVAGIIVDNTGGTPITFVRAQALTQALLSGKYSFAADHSAHTQTNTYYKANGTTVLCTSTTQYNTAETQITGRTTVWSNLP